jgi:hypothetical protein
MYVLENTSADPFQGSFVEKGQITDSTNKWAIDGTVLNNGGALYFIWSGWEGDTDTGQNLYIASMSNPWTINSGRVLISSPTLSWEKSVAKINEGPEVIIKNGKINLVYSADASWSDSYKLGLLTAGSSSNLLSGSSWSKKSTPIFQSGNGLYGPGHQSFTKSADGTEDWIIYHTAKYSGAGWNREIRAQKFTWNTDNTPNLGAPANPNVPIAIPSGEPGRLRYEGENGTFNRAYASPHSLASNGYKAGHIDYSDSYVEFNISIETAGEYILFARTGNGMSDWSNHKLSVNGGPPSDFWVTNKGWDNWGTSTANIYLNAGTNQVRFSKGTSYAELDVFDLFPASGGSLAGIVSGGVYKLINPQSGKALDVAGAGTENGTNVQIWEDFNGGIAQKWRIIPVYGDVSKLINPNSGKALDILNGGITNGTNVQIWEDNGGNAQKWKLVRVE